MGQGGTRAAHSLRRGGMGKRHYLALGSALITSPNNSQVAPLNLVSLYCSMGEKSVAEVLIVTPGCSIDSANARRFAACAMTFSRLRSSPHRLRTSSKV